MYDVCEVAGQRVPVFIGEEKVTEEEFERFIAFSQMAVLDTDWKDEVEKWLREEKWREPRPFLVK
jgi:hypothetical protein